MSSTLDVTFERNFFYTLALHFIDKYEDTRDNAVSKEFCLNTFTVLQSENCGCSRIKTLGKFVVNNMFVNDTNTDTILYLYMHVTRYIGLLTRMISRWKHRRMSVHNDSDLLLIPVSSYSPHILTTIIDKGEKYVFKIPDLLNMVFSALTNSEDRWYAAPTKIKNPYTGLPFSLGNIYNIFLAVHESTFRMPALFSIFIDIGCNLTVFGMNYECLLREIMIENNVRNLSKPELSTEIRYMLSNTTAYSPLERDDEIIVRIHEAFPSDIMISVFKPYLTPYYTHKYSLNPFIRHKSEETLVKKLIVFRKDNPMFGRRLVSSTTRFSSNRFITTRNRHFNEYVRQTYYDIDIENIRIPYRSQRRNAITSTNNHINIPPVPRANIQGASNLSLSNRNNGRASGSGYGQLSDVIIEALLDNPTTNNNLMNMVTSNLSTSSLANHNVAQIMADTGTDNIMHDDAVAVISDITDPDITDRNYSFSEIGPDIPNIDIPSLDIPNLDMPELEIPEREEEEAHIVSDNEISDLDPVEPEMPDLVPIEPEMLYEPGEPEIPGLPEPHEMNINEVEPESEEKEELQEQEEKSDEPDPSQYEPIDTPSPRRQSTRSALSNYRMNI